MTIEEAKTVIYGNVVYACEKAGFSPYTTKLVQDACDMIIATADRKTENSSEKPNNSTISKMEQVDEPKTQTETQNSNLTFEKDECSKEYEELGLAELKALRKADEPQTEREGE